MYILNFRHNEKTTPILHFINLRLHRGRRLTSCDPCSNDSSQIDTDGDGVYNDMDLFPFNDTEWADSDGDGVGD